MSVAAATAAFPDLAPFLIGNAEWANAINASDPSFLPTLAQGQAPPVVWIGCADSRVPESVIMNQKPGQVFTHRNIANQYIPGDANAGAVVDYAISHLNTSHVVVVGHKKCGGAAAAFDAPKPAPDAPEPTEPLDVFLEPLIELRHTLPADATVDDLIVANVQSNVINVVNSDTIQHAWEQGKRVCVHGWLYDVQTGLLDDLGFSQCEDKAGEHGGGKDKGDKDKDGKDKDGKDKDGKDKDGKDKDGKDKDKDKDGKKCDDDDDKKDKDGKKDKWDDYRKGGKYYHMGKDE